MVTPKFGESFFPSLEHASALMQLLFKAAVSFFRLLYEAAKKCSCCGELQDNLLKSTTSFRFKKIEKSHIKKTQHLYHCMLVSSLFMMYL